MERKIPRKDKPKFEFDENLVPYSETGSMVIRLEHVLAGKPLRKMLKHADNLYNLFIGYYNESIDTLWKKLDMMPDEAEDEEYQQYLENKELLTKQRGEISYEECQTLCKLLDEAIAAIKDGKAPVAVKPEKIDRYYESFDPKDVFRSSANLKTVQLSLEKIMIKPKRALYLDRIVEMTETLSFLTECQEKNLCFAVNRKVLFSHYDEIVEILSKMNGKKQVELVIDDDGDEIEPNTPDRRIPYTYTLEEMKKIGSLVRDCSAKVYFSEFYTENFMPFNRKDLWGYKEVMLANYHRHNFAKTAEPLNLSPMEIILCVNDHISDLRYTGHATNDEKTRTIIPAQQTIDRYSREMLKQSGKGFVCTSEASYAKALVDDFKNENIEISLVNISFYNRTTERKDFNAVHLILLVHLKDEEHGINGYYMWDPTWSARSGVSNCLFPVEDIENYDNNSSIVDDKLEFPKSTLYLHSPRKDKLGRDDSNIAFNNKYQFDSTPIKVRVFEEAYRKMYQKVKQSPKMQKLFFLKDMNGSVEDLVSDSMNRTLHSLFTFDPERSKNDFYKMVRFYIFNSAKEDEDLLDYANWAGLVEELSYDTSSHRVKQI